MIIQHERQGNLSFGEETVPSRPRALTRVKVKVKVKAKVKHMVGPIQGAHGGKSIG